MNNILLLIENKLYRNSEKKYGINFLSNFYNIFLCDLSGYTKGSKINDFETINNKYEFIQPKNIEEFSFNTKKLKFVFALDFLAYSKKAFDIRLCLKRQNIKIVKKQGASPVLNSLRNQLIVKNFNYLMNIINSRSYYHEIGISECLLSDKNFFIKQAKKKIFSHSEDFNDYLNFNGNYYENDKRYAVFIDDMISNHPDYEIIHQVPPPTDLNTYLKEMSIFFEKFENNTGIEVILLPHPKADLNYKERLVSKRKFFDGKVIELIKNSELVFVHESTAISFPVIFNKPIIYLKNNQIIKSWMNQYIDLKANITGSKILNISEHNFSNFDINNSLNLDKKKYLTYIENYIKHPKSKKIDTWETLINEFNSL